MESLFCIAVNATVKIAAYAAGSLLSDLLIGIPSALCHVLSDTL